MKHSLMYASAALLVMASCGKEDKIETLVLSPETSTVITDGTLPELALTATPEGILDGKTVVWTSDKPEVLSVAEDGKLSLEVKDLEEETDVTVTATVDGVSASATVTVKGLIAHYEVIDMTADLGFYILDRNVGAASPEEIGNFYQWGKNTPVASNNDTEVNENYDAEWGAESEGFADWSKPENTPCPMGWGLPDEDSMNEISNKTYIAWWGYTDADFAAVRDLLGQMNLLVNTGSFDKNHTTKDPDILVNFWASPEGTDGNHWMFQYSNGNVGRVYIVKTGNPHLAIPVRCIKK